MLVLFKDTNNEPVTIQVEDIQQISIDSEASYYYVETSDLKIPILKSTFTKLVDILKNAGLLLDTTSEE